MSIRDEEIKRLEHYAQALGIKVMWEPYKAGSHIGATCTVDASEITLCYRPTTSKMQLVLNFIHELAHALAYINSGRQEDFKTNNALDAEDERENSDPPLPKEQRKLIYICERDDAQYRDKIYNEVDIRIPKYRFIVDKELDIWIYYRYYLMGKFPTYKSIKRKKQELIQKYKEQNGH